MSPLELPSSPAVGATTLGYEVVRDPMELHALQDEWSRLWQRCLDATPFQSPAWLLPWWHHFGREFELRVFLWRHGGRVIGIAPCVLRRERRVLRFLGCGVSDYQGPLAAPGHDRGIIDAFWALVFDRASEWDRIELGGLRTCPCFDPAIASREGWNVNLAAGEPSPVLSLAPSEQGQTPADWRRKLDYDWRRLKRTGSVEIEAATTGNISSLLETLFRLHTERWARDGQPGVLADPAVQGFHHEAAPHALHQGSLQLHVLRINGAAVAVYYGFRSMSRAYYYLGGFDSAWSRFGVGNLALDYAIATAAREGAVSFDFLRGSEAYKYRWGARDEPIWLVRAEKHAA